MESSFASDLPLPKIVSMILDMDGHVTGCQNLLKYVNPPFNDDDIILLEAERRLFWENSCREPSQEVRPLWIENNYCESQKQTSSLLELCYVSRSKSKQKEKPIAVHNRSLRSKFKGIQISKACIPAANDWISSPQIRYVYLCIDEALVMIFINSFCTFRLI
jgi:hypothetical protein